MKLKDLAEQFYDLHVMANNAPTQQKAVREQLRNWILPHLGDREVDELTAFDVVKFKAAMQKRKLAPATVNLRLKTLSKMLQCGRAWKLTSVVIDFDYLPVAQKDAEFFSEAQLIRIFRVALGAPWDGMVRIALHTGMRIGELRGLQWDDIDFPAKQLRVRRAAASHFTELRTPKSRKPRTVALNDQALLVLGTLPHLGPFVFTLDGALLSYDRAYHALQRILAAAEIKGEYGWHSFRHSFGSHIAMSGESLRTLQDLMGHANLSTTMRYAHLSPGAGAEAVGVLNKIKT
jgi:integrase